MPSLSRKRQAARSELACGENSEPGRRITESLTSNPRIREQPRSLADHAFSDIRHECFPFSGIKATANGGYSCRHGHADHAFSDIRHECFPFSAIKATTNGGCCFAFPLLCILRIIRGSCPAITRKDYAKVKRFGSARPKGQP